MSIRNWPSAERPREKLLAKGAKSLSDAELLAIFLRTGSRGKSALQLARDLLKDFGGLRELLGANLDRFCQIRGLGSAKFAQLQAVLELARRHRWEQIQEGDALESPTDTREYLAACLGHYTHEVFACLYLDTRHRVIHFEELFHGTIDGAAVYPRQVVKKALAYNAAAVIMAHNHPSGVAEPSQADRHLTQRLCKALALVDIRVLDHVVIGARETVSFAERGIL